METRKNRVIGHLEKPGDFGLIGWDGACGSDELRFLGAVGGVIFVLRRALHTDFLSCRRSSAFEPCEALEIIDQVGHADLDPGASDADGTDDEAHAVFLSGKDMLNGSADL